MKRMMKSPRWVGKRLPDWLYKLHGLNISYSCEIFGNQVYKGPKAFQKHFNEWRHFHGMRCLGISNTAHFANITQIKDALDLTKLKETRNDRGGIPTMMKNLKIQLEMPWHGECIKISIDKGFCKGAARLYCYLFLICRHSFDEMFLLCRIKNVFSRCFTH